MAHNNTDDPDIDTYLSTRTPLQKKNTSANFSWFKILMVFLGIQIVLVLYTINHHLEKELDQTKNSSITDDEYSKLLNKSRLVFDSMEVRVTKKLCALFLASVTSSIILLIICRLFTKLLIKVSIVSLIVLYIIYIISYIVIFKQFSDSNNSNRTQVSRDPKLKSDYSVMELFFAIIFLPLVGSSIYLAVSSVTINVISPIIKESYKLMIKFPLATVLFCLMTYFSFLTAKLGLFVTIELLEIWKEEQKKLFLFYFLHVFNAIFTLWIMIFFWSFGTTFLSKIYATWYWTVDKHSLAQCKTVFKALWITARYDLGVIAFGTSPCYIVPVLETLWRNALSTMSNFKGLPLLFKIPFCLDALLRALPSYGLYIGASHISGFRLSTKVAGIFYFKNAYKFFAVNSVFVMMGTINVILWKTPIDAIVKMIFINDPSDVSQYMYFSLDTKKPLLHNASSTGYEKNDGSLTIFEHYIFLSVMLSFLVSIYVSISTMLLCTAESTERNNRTKGQNLSNEFNVEKLEMDQEYNTRL